MKNLQTIAASYNLYSLDNLPTEFKESYNKLPNYKKEIEASFPKILKQYKSIETGVYFNCESGENYTTIENVTILVKSKNNDIVCVLNSDYASKGKFEIMVLWELTTKLRKNLSSYKASELYNAIKKPNKIGVFTEKKVNDWLTWCSDYYNLLKLENNKAENKIAESESKLDKIISQLKSKTEQIGKSNDSSRTYIYTKNFDLTIEIDRSGNFYTKVHYKGDLETTINLILSN